MLIEKQVHGEIIVAQLSLVGLVTLESLKQGIRDFVCDIYSN